MDVFDKCVGDKKRTKFTITGHTVINYCISPFTIWCEYFAPFEARDPENAYMRLLFDRGHEHERNIVESNYKDAELIAAKSFETGFKIFLENGKKGAKSFVHAPLFFLSEDIYGITDVLERDDSHPSIFGKHHYVVKEIKSAKHIKHEYVLQGAFYNYLLGKIQGYTPKKFYLINRDGEESSYDFEKYEEELKNILDGIREIQKGKNVTPTAKSCRWPWESYCNSKAVEAGDVSILPSVGPAVKRKLNEAGIQTIHQLSETPVDIDIPEPTLEKIKKFAEAWTTKKPVILHKPKFEKSDVDLFIDFEGTDDMQTEEGVIKVNYLIGLLVSEKERVHFRPFIAENLNDEGRMLQEFLEYVKKYPDAPIYHYGPYEKTHFASMGQKFKVNVKPVLDRMVDILTILKKSVAMPVMSNSLKEVGKMLGYKWRGMASAQESIVLYFQYLDSKDRSVLQRIIDYNEDDVRATKVVKDYLAGLTR